MSENTARSFVLLIQWSDGRSEQLEIPTEPWPGRSCPLLEVGPKDQEPGVDAVELFSPNGRKVIAKVIIHGDETPSMLICPAPPGPFSVTGERLSVAPEPEPKTEPTHEPICARCDSDRPGPCEACTELATAVPDGGNGAPGVPVATETTPEWLAEFMHELCRRHNLRSPEGCEAAMTEAATTSDSFGFRCRSCASLARGYRSAGGALVAIAEQDEEGWARHNDEASRHFREAIDLARQGEEVGA